MKDVLRYHRPAREAYNKLERDEYSKAWREHLEINLPILDAEVYAGWLRERIRWCLYFSGKRERMP
jgi:hypothetical protein